MTIRETEDGASSQFVMPDGSPHMPWYTGDTLPNLLRFQLGKQRASIAKITSMQDPAATTILPRWSGEPFHLHECVQALFRIKLPDQDQQAALSGVTWLSGGLAVDAVGAAAHPYAGFALDDAHIDFTWLAHVHALSDRETCSPADHAELS
jgi:hypothetical protein